MGLNIFLSFLLHKILSISDYVSNSLSILSKIDSSTIGQDDIFQRISGNFSTKIEMKSRKQQRLIKSLFVSKLLIYLILLILLIVIISNLFKVISLISGLFSLDRRIFQSNTRVKFIVHELHQDNIEI